MNPPEPYPEEPCDPPAGRPRSHPHVDSITAQARLLDEVLSNADETGAPIGPALDHLRQIIAEAEAALAELRPRLANTA
ncbi:hypothetical protein KGD82_16660 [Nocardiopsis eucommiae]|uniref:Uncharacterized protein n=1 Tax=Nocardiopsis eucommiae TaxID=2831970 RepID=A0A975L8C0_9ACTN|nr:hypothetical protein KGD82_16660 [Nocardiopsis eucommiae]